MTTKYCVHCNKPFETTNSKKKYCMKYCADRYWAEHNVKKNRECTRKSAMKIYYSLPIMERRRIRNQTYHRNLKDNEEHRIKNIIRTLSRYHLKKKGACERCGSKELLAFHHFAYEIDLVETLCKTCHKLKHSILEGEK